MTTTRRGRSASLIPENDDEVRIERVHEIRQAIAVGSYGVPAEQLAACVIAAAMVCRDEDE